LAFRVDIAEPALMDVEQYVQFIREVRKDPEAAERWFRGLVEAIYSLEDLPDRCPVIPEHDEFPFEIRHLIYFSHRIVFRVEREIGRVVVYRVYHGARQRLNQTDITDVPQPEP
jgi:plasmid stabilization system protein ParE